MDMLRLIYCFLLGFKMSSHIENYNQSEFQRFYLFVLTGCSLCAAGLRGPDSVPEDSF
ncbi:hypothetical protein QTP70_018910 [Hemibagrus guttatus]|uniref:Uncharacterized protein n=1 Tax=Hemibagrus guttatus TaxID=175788 RepID=A0AAE0UH92_9TELE|nr:hypothetical protein QTP70_018910 [Hemibagrus guttatus]